MTKNTKNEVNKKRELQRIEKSAKISTDFIYDEIIPALEHFETYNEYSGYLYGTATHCLFVELVQRMGELGYTEKELRKELKTYLDPLLGETLH